MKAHLIIHIIPLPFSAFFIYFPASESQGYTVSLSRLFYNLTLRFISSREHTVYICCVWGVEFIVYQRSFCSFRQMSNKSKVAFSESLEAGFVFNLHVVTLKEEGCLTYSSCWMQVDFPRPIQWTKLSGKISSQN